MSHTAAFLNWCKARKAAFCAVIGSVIYILTILAQGLQDPLWTWLLFIGGTIALAVGLGLAQVLNEKIVSPIHNHLGEPMVKTRRVAPQWVIIMLVAVLALSPVLFIYLWSRPHNSLQAVFIDHVEVLHPNGAKVDGKVYFAGEPAFDEGEEKDYNSLFFLSNGFYLQFFVQKAHRHKNVAIERVEVSVVDFEPQSRPPEYGPPQVMPFRDHNLYLVEIDAPRKAGGSKFVCDHFYEWKEPGSHDEHRFAAKLLEHDNPESMVVKIEARSPGVYTLDLNLLVSVGASRESIAVWKRKKVLFPLNDVALSVE